ncbi:MAG: hypothetical protein EOP48_15380 [Sphingobacteriales bacterium]|nr:MAG: hypothetical protein EOP48_15380 [Sphingobacteriales bacterium]
MGIALPIFLDLLSVQSYFFLKGESIFTNTFFDIDFILIVSYILLLNIAYGLANINRRRLALLKQKHEWQLYLIQKEVLTVTNLQRMERIKRFPVSLLGLDLESAGIEQEQIACAYKIDGTVTVHYFGMPATEVKQSINKTLSVLNEMEYIKINSTCFYHRLLIFSYEENVSSRRLYLRLRHPFNHLNHNQQRIVSQSMSVRFKKWFDDV